MPDTLGKPRRRAPLADDAGSTGETGPAADSSRSAEQRASDSDAPRMASNPGNVEGGAAAAGRPIEDLTLSELIESWMRSPGQTWRALRIASASEARHAPRVAAPSAMAPSPSATDAAGSSLVTAIQSAARGLQQVNAIQLLLYVIAIACAFAGSVLLRGSDDVPRADEISLIVGAPFLWLGFLLWLAAEAIGEWACIRERWRAMDRRARLRWSARALPVMICLIALFRLTAAMTAPTEDSKSLALSALSLFLAGGLLWFLIEFAFRQLQGRTSTAGGAAALLADRQKIGLPIAADISGGRKLLIALATACSLTVWLNTSGNRIEPPVIALWLLSAGLWAFVFAPLRWNIFDWASAGIDAARRMRLRNYRLTIVALLLIMLLGAGFRLYELDAYQPQMFSDLVEKIQDAYKIRHLNDYRIFFDNIGGREPLHFYLLSILASQPGMAFDHYALKLMSALESLVALPIMFWLGVEVMGGRRRSFALLFGLLAAGLVAASFWHAAIGRQGMRISLAPLFSALMAVYLIRALRYNRRSDFVKAGLALGFGLMGYQAVRMLPVAAVAGVAVAVALCRQSMRARLSYILNLGVLAFVALMVFLPLLHYWTESPENYMRRANTRLFGDMPTTGEERAAFLLESVPVLLSNIRQTALMFHYLGDNTWVSGLAQEPAMDPATAAFMLLGVAAWLALVLRSRDPVFFFVPVYLFAMLLPTALALSFPIEVPSFIRASGAIPPSYLIAALPVAVFCRRLRTSFSGRAGFIIAAAFAVGLLLAANHYNTRLYFGEFTDNYARASHPQAQAGRILRGFAESDGGYGNAFVLTSPHWWDIRAIGIEAGLMFWDSGGDVSQLPQLLERGLWREGKFRLQPERDLLFFYSRGNEDALPLLSAWFPNGRPMEIAVQPAHNSFFIYRAPALGAQGLRRFLDERLPAS